MALAAPALAADNSTRLLQCVPAGTPFVAHHRSVAKLVTDWAKTPYAKMWAAEPSVRAFFAPALEFLSSDEAQAGFAKFEEATGLRPAEFLGMVTGEFVFAADVAMNEEGEPRPRIALGFSVGDNKAKLEAAVGKVLTLIEGESSAAELEVSEVQGASVRTLFKLGKDEGDEPREETLSWSLVDDVMWVGYPAAAVQQVVANYKGSGAEEPITTSATFSPVYGRNPNSDLCYYLDLQRLVTFGLEAYQKFEAARSEAAEAALAEGGEPPENPAAMLEQMGLTAEAIVRALGLDALQCAYLVGSTSDGSSEVTMGINWTERRGLLRMLGYGEPPAPQPDFISPDWATVNVSRFKVSEIWESVKEVARTANPMFEFMLAQQLAALKQQVGIDVENDLWGSFGDEVIAADQYTVTDDNGVQDETLVAISLANAEALTRVLETALAMGGPQVSSMMESRDYLGQTIHTIAIPMGDSGFNSVSYAITPTYFFLGVNGSAMIETSIQRIAEKGESFWSLPAVAAALQDVPAGSSAFSFTDLGRLLHPAMVQMAEAARMTAMLEQDPDSDEEEGDGDEGPGRNIPGLHKLIDPDAVPETDAIAKYFGPSYGGVYLDANGIRIHERYKNVP